MRLDPIIQRRFAELATKADSVAETRQLDFMSDSGTRYYKVQSALFVEWATSFQNLLARTFGRDSVHFANFATRFDDFSGSDSQFEQCRAVFRAAREDYEGGYLFNVRSLAKAEVLSDALSQARQLLEAGYKDPACVLARVALEATLKETADAHGVAHGKLDRMNADLCKAGIYNMAKQKQITAWADIGNNAAHGNWNQYNDHDALVMVDGVEALVADLM
jgi:Domain of unknown function (DUF4145)